MVRPLHHNKHTLEKIILIIILLIGAWMRLYRSAEFFPFWSEQADDMLAIRHIWQTIQSGKFNQLPLKGQTGTYRWSYIPSRADNPVYHGVAYYYLLLPAAVISHFQPYGVVLFIMLFGIMTIYLLYRAGILLFGSTAVGLVAAGLGACSFWLAAYSRWIWTPSMVPFFSILSLVSFLQVTKGKRGWWYILAVSLSVGSQIHDSGYVPLLFYLSMLFVYKPSLPKKFMQRLFLVLLFFIPLLPTILFEVTTGWTMTKALLKVIFGFAAGTTGSHVVSLLGTMIGGIASYVVEAFGLTMMNIHYVRRFIDVSRGLDPLLAIIAFLIGIVLLLGVYEKVRHPTQSFSPYRRLLVSWWIVCIPVSLFVEYLYLDEGINDYSRMNNLVFILPIFFLCLAYIVVYVWKQNRLWLRMCVAGGVFTFIILNGLTIRDYLWRHTENDWDYAQLQELAHRVPTAANGQAYNVWIYKYNEGTFGDTTVYETLYGIDLLGLRMPETFNGIGYWGMPRQQLGAAPAKQSIIVIDKTYRGMRDLPGGAKLVGETKNFVIYKVEN